MTKSEMLERARREALADLRVAQGYADGALLAIERLREQFYGLEPVGREAMDAARELVGKLEDLACDLTDDGAGEDEEEVDVADPPTGVCPTHRAELHRTESGHLWCDECQGPRFD